eukprot:GHRR01007598.1.p1 GENE.GHRR01007598.1~~GHRR01007598.1.p1  ORF type:complete len:168 (+),score=44.79 GHRR01007598.1:1649-2152(+)
MRNILVQLRVHSSVDRHVINSSSDFGMACLAIAPLQYLCDMLLQFCLLAVQVSQHWKGLLHAPVARNEAAQQQWRCIAYTQCSSSQATGTEGQATCIVCMKANHLDKVVQANICKHVLRMPYPACLLVAVEMNLQTIRAMCGMLQAGAGVLQAGAGRSGTANCMLMC